MLKDVVGKTPARHARSPAPRKGCWSPSTARAASICRSSPRSTASPRTAIIAELGDLIYRDPESEDLADRRRLSLGQCAGEARRRRGRRPGLRPQRRGAAAGAARGRAARRHRRQSRGAVDTGDATSRRSPPSCSASRPSAIQVGHLKKDAVWSVDAGLRRRAVGRRHRRVRHAAGQRHLAAGAGPQHEDAGHLRHDPRRRPRGAGRQPGGDAGRPREAEADQGAVPGVGVRRSRAHRAAGAALQRHLQQPAAAALRRLAPRLPRHEPDDPAAARTRRTPSGGA